MPDVVLANDASFDDVVLKRPGVVLVDFGAVWCPPCRAMDPVLQAMADDGAAVVKVDVDDSPATAARYGVRGMPTFVVFRDGVPVGQLVGKQSRAVVEAALARAGA